MAFDIAADRPIEMNLYVGVDEAHNTTIHEQ